MMQNFKTLGEELGKSGKGKILEELANSPDGQKLCNELNMEKAEKAAKSGDVAAMQSIIKGVLETEEGKRLAESVMKLMES